MNRMLRLIPLVALACSHGSASKDSATTTSAAPPRASAEVDKAPATDPRAAGPGHHGAMHGQRMAAMCPMDVPGTQVSAADTPKGEALSFTTSSPGGAAELRSRVRAMAEMHNAHHGEGHAAAGARHGHGGAMHPTAPPASAAVEEIEGGARLVISPKDPADLARVQEFVRSRAERLRTSGCAGVHGEG